MRKRIYGSAPPHPFSSEGAWPAEQQPTSVPMIRILAAALVSIVPAGAFAVEIETAKGPVAIDRTPARVAVFDIAALDTLDRLGVTPIGVPNKLYVPQLEPLGAKAARVGTLFEPDLEALNALEPDLVIVGGRSSPRAAATRKVAQTIDMSIQGESLIAEAKARLAAYGELFGKQEAAKAVAAELDAAAAAARSAVSGKGKALVVMTAGPRVSVYGEGTRFGWIHKELGLTPAIPVTAKNPHGEAASFELIAETNPDWLIVLDRAAAIGDGAANARATLDNELVARTTAWKTGQVVYLPAADFYISGGGVQSLTRVLASITDAFSKAR